MTSTWVPVQQAASRHRRGGGQMVLVVLLAATAYLAASVWTQISAKPVLSATQAADCDLHQDRCVATFMDGSSIQLDLEPKIVLPAKPIQLSIATAGFDADSIAVAFSGTDMNMGRFETGLIKIDDATFAGESILPVCVRRTMVWQATVTAESGDRVYRGTYTFATNR